MTITTEERIFQHAAYINTELIIDLLDNINYDDLYDLPWDQFEMLERIQKVFKYLKEVFDRSLPWLISTNSLSNLNSQIEAIRNDLKNYLSSDKNDQHLTDGFNRLEAILPYFSEVTIFQTPEDIEKEKEEIKEAVKNNTSRLNEFSSTIDSQKSRVDSVISDIQGQFSQAQEHRSSTFNDFLQDSRKDMEQDLDIQMDHIQERFKTYANQYGGRFERYQKSFDQQTSEYQSKFDSLFEDYEIFFKERFDEINKMNAEAEKIIGIISMKGLAQGYQKIANNEGKKAFSWNLGSIAAMITVLAFGFFFIVQHEGVFEWTTLISRIVLTGLGVTLFTYCAKQATNHRNEERRNRKIELELASLDPYLKDLEPKEQKKVKQALVDKYFGVDLTNSVQTEKNVAETMTANQQFIQTLAEKVAPILSKSKKEDA